MPLAFRLSSGVMTGFGAVPVAARVTADPRQAQPVSVQMQMSTRRGQEGGGRDHCPVVRNLHKWKTEELCKAGSPQHSTVVDFKQDAK